MTRQPDLAAQHAWPGAFVSASLNAVGMPGDFLMAHEIPDMPLYPSLLSALTGAALVVVLLVRRPHATVRLGSVVFLINTLAVLAALWVTACYWGAGSERWTPFQANKLGALAMPLLAPQLGVGLAAIGGFAGTAIGKFFMLDPAIQRRLPVGEPWIVLAFALFGAVLLAYRLRGLRLERELLRANAEAAAAEQVARTFLRLRDYANTPIQTIVLATKMIRVSNPDLGAALERLERAADRLMALSRALTRYESTHTWGPGDESLDAALVAVQLPRSVTPRQTKQERDRGTLGR